MRVLADCHHYELFYSLQLLFEKRLNAELYRPIGMDWYHQGYWHVFPHIDTAKQYLSTEHHLKDMQFEDNYSLCLNKNFRVEDGIYYVNDATKDKVNRGITLDKFKELEFDIVISSIPQHIGPFNRLIQQFQPRAKHIFQVGNAWGHLPGVQNILASAAPFPVTPDINACFYHQEFDLNTFSYEPPKVHNVVNSYIHWMNNKELMNQYASRVPDWRWTSYGAGMEDHIVKTKDLAQAMKDSAFTWHYKPEGDGYGHVIHNTFACGRPAIIWAPFYNTKLASQLLIDQQTCIDISSRPIQQNMKLIRRFSQPEEHARMCENAHKRFQEVVNFDQEEAQIRTFLENLR